MDIYENKSQYQYYQQCQQWYQQQYPVQNQTSYQQALYTIPKKMPSGKKGFIYGLISVILLPVFYNPFMLWIVWVLSIIGLVYSINGLKTTPKEYAITGLILSAFPIASHFILWLISDLIALFT